MTHQLDLAPFADQRANLVHGFLWIEAGHNPHIYVDFHLTGHDIDLVAAADDIWAGGIMQDGVELPAQVAKFVQHGIGIIGIEQLTQSIAHVSAQPIGDGINHVLRRRRDVNWQTISVQRFQGFGQLVGGVIRGCGAGRNHARPVRGR